MRKFLFWPEIHENRGTGHLHECCCLAQALDGECLIVIPPWGPAKQIVDSYGLDALPVEAGEEEAVLKQHHDDKGFDSIIVNRFDIDRDIQDRLRAIGFRVVVIDQTGGKTITADILINSSPVPAWHDYDYPGEKPECLFGPDYFLLRQGFQKARQKDKPFYDAPRRVLASMGGVDRTGATLRVIEALKTLPTSVPKEIILGPGFAHHDKLDEKTRKRLDRSFNIHDAVDDIERHMMRCDLLISAGGTTVLEAAALGLPTLVLWEDPHEEVYSRAVADACGIEVVGNGMEADIDTVGKTVFDWLADKSRRKDVSARQRAFLDGKGAARIAALLQQSGDGKDGT